MRQMSAVVKQRCSSTVRSDGPLGLQNITSQFNHCLSNCSAWWTNGLRHTWHRAKWHRSGHRFTAREGRAPLDDSKVFHWCPRPITVVRSFFSKVTFGCSKTFKHVFPCEAVHNTQACLTVKADNRTSALLRSFTSDHRVGFILSHTCISVLQKSVFTQWVFQNPELILGISV